MGSLNRIINTWTDESFVLTLPHFPLPGGCLLQQGVRRLGSPKIYLREEGYSCSHVVVLNGWGLTSVYIETLGSLWVGMRRINS